jgi:hypothetical protein
LKLADIECQIAGRIVNDFLQIEDMAEIIMDSYLQHPWIREGYEVERYAPQMLEVWNDIRADEQIDLRSENSDGSKRAFRFCPLDLSFDENGETMLMLPNELAAQPRTHRVGTGTGPCSAAENRSSLGGAGHPQAPGAVLTEFPAFRRIPQAFPGRPQRAVGTLQPPLAAEPAQQQRFPADEPESPGTH